MKVSLLTQNLQKKLSFLNHAVSNKSQLPILLNILIETRGEKITLVATDLEIGIQTTISAIVEEEGSTTIPARAFSELIASLSEETVTLETHNETFTVTTKKTKSVFQTTPKEEFPSLYEHKGEQIAVLSPKAIQQDLSSVIFSASTDTTRPALSGVLVRKEQTGFLFVTTDGFRLSLKHYTQKEKTTQEDFSLLVPSRVFKELLSMKDEEQEIAVFVSEGSNQILFEQAETILVGRLIDAAFPPFEKIIPSDFSVRVTFDPEEMQKAVKICSIFAKDAANIIKFSLRKDHIVVSSSSASVGENTVTVESVLQGEENEIAFNARYLLDFFANVSAPEMVFEMVGPLNPGVFTIKDDPSYLHLIMPIRVQG